VKCWPILFAAASGLFGQSVDIYSEFQRIDPYGAIVPADRSLQPREILSPGVARSGWASFHVAVHVPRNESYLLYVATNPLDACRVALYKEHFLKTAGGWIPDRLTELERLPDFGFMPDPDDSVPGQNTRLYLLDLWIPPTAPVGRFRLEVQLKTGFWVVRPMEVRVLAARIPELPSARTAPALPPVESPADAAAAGPFAALLASSALNPSTPPDSVRAVIYRNTVQDMALARELKTRPESLRDLWASIGFPRLLGAEWWLRLRDSVYSAAK
jgi:hypothetical protein